LACCSTAGANDESCAVVIPVYNEERVIGETVTRILGHLRCCSWLRLRNNMHQRRIEDGTAAVSRACRASPSITHEVNRGYGAALRSGLDYCSQEWIFITDADGTYPLDDLPRLLASAEEVDMVVGNAKARESAIARRTSSHDGFCARWCRAHRRPGAGPQLGMRVFRKALYQEFRHLLPMGLLVHHDIDRCFALQRTARTLRSDQLRAAHRKSTSSRYRTSGLLNADRALGLLFRATALFPAGRPLPWRC
jgi:hypothetical protein